MQRIGRQFLASLILVGCIANSSAGLERREALAPATPDGQIPLLLQTSLGSQENVAQRVRDLGGRVTHQFENTSALSVTLPADRVADLLADPRVESGQRSRLVSRQVETVRLLEGSRSAATRAPVLDGEFALLGRSGNDFSVRPVPLAEVAREAAARGEGGAEFFAYDNVTGAAEAWQTAGLGEGVTVAIIDTGVYPEHEMFQGNVIGGINLVPALEEQAIDANGDGTPEGVSFDWDAIENDGHGSFCAGIVAGHADVTFDSTNPLVISLQQNKPGAVDVGTSESVVRLRGVAPGASIFAVKVFPYDGGGAPDARVAEAIDRLITMKREGVIDVDVISMSLSGPVLYDGWNPLDQMVDIASLHGITCVSAASNDGPSLTTVGSPGSAFSSLTVGAVLDPLHMRVASEVIFGIPVGGGATLYPSDDERMIDFSARGLTADGRVKPDLVATGFLVFSSGLADFDRNGINESASFGFGSGTSFSTPTVAGAAALVVAHGNRLGSLGRAPYVANVLRKSAAAIASKTSVSEREQGRGYVHIPGALQMLEDGRYLTPPPTNAAHPALEELSIVGGFASAECPALAPGETYNFLVEVPRNVGKLTFDFESVTLDANENPIFGEALALAIHSAKRGGNGDYVFEESAFSGGVAPGTTFELATPEAGTIRVTFMSSPLNYGEASATFSIRADRSIPVPEVILSDVVRRNQTVEHVVEIPEGLDALGIRLAWKHDWSKFPTFDLDLLAQMPDGVVTVATLDSPEMGIVQNPTPGEWTFSITDFGTALGEEPYSLELFFMEPKPTAGNLVATPAVPRLLDVSSHPVRGPAEFTFEMPRDSQMTSVRVFDVGGRAIRTLLDGAVSAGSQTVAWDRTTDQGNRTVAGIYFVRVQNEAGFTTRKIVVLD